uniref:translin-associated protein X isoform X1 n=2 Tax=Pristiophorus japonicus TaxID=55135 RepID=UPI00398F55EC
MTHRGKACVSSPWDTCTIALPRTGGFRKRKHDNMQPRNRKEEGESKINPSSPVLLSFKSFQKELDAKHDKYERLVKLSRDITIESKRTIFLLHRVTSISDIEELLSESETRFGDIRRRIQQIAQELIGEDMCQFHRAFSPGLQEYVEAVSFQHFIRTRSLISLEEINRHLVFTPKKEEAENSEDPALSDSQDEKQQILYLQVTPTDYLLGIADLTGELMRMCITSVGNGDIETPFEVSQFLRAIYDGFTYIGNTGPYEVSKKLYTLKQSLGKVEDVCYTLTVRGSEIPKHMLADVLSSKASMIEHEEGM